MVAKDGSKTQHDPTRRRAAVVGPRRRGDGRARDCERSEYDVLSGLLVGALQLWVLSEPTDGSTDIKAMSVTQVVMYPQCRHAEIIMASGDDPEKWLEFEDDFVAWAKGQGCDRMRIQTPRRGWAKVLPHWDQTAIIMERTI